MYVWMYVCTGWSSCSDLLYIFPYSSPEESSFIGVQYKNQNIRYNIVTVNTIAEAPGHSTLLTNYQGAIPTVRYQLLCQETLQRVLFFVLFFGLCPMPFQKMGFYKQKD